MKRELQAVRAARLDELIETFKQQLAALEQTQASIKAIQGQMAEYRPKYRENG